MKKILFLLIISILIISSTIYAYSDGFEYMTKTLDIPLTNLNGNYINEDIYNRYNLIVYGTP